jgi:DNA invertase Pin-like site-specific DNA recombinase
MEPEPTAVVYVRVSTEEQARGGVSLDAQEERVQAYCHLAGLKVEALIREEGVSGSVSLAERPAGRRLIALVQGGKASHVVSMKLDRLFRNAEDALAQTRAWDKAGVALHVCDMGGAAVNTGSAMGRMFITVMAGFAELERNLISERTATALRHKKARLDVYGSTPLGFDRVGKRLRPNPEELATISRIRKMKDEGCALGEIARTLNYEHVPTKRGREWHSSTVRYLLQNRMYEGAA